ncbi:hypothetical protein CDL15_Pgr018621 [Punica granatum]|uniref:Uncharacterized protein n=1 Tax=Punica granatum TaxID=22663 RepID=A0A218X142_PUNGR|nr:hypothetical protein CDL15_Pgr018621 [Punica granatum]PKI59427.1 hypothetical protein CRG98_020186 [Punica granatum]
MNYSEYIQSLFGLGPIKLGPVRSSATVKSYSREGVRVHLSKTWEARRASRGKGRISELVVDEEPRQASRGGGASASLTWLGSLDESVGLFGLGLIKLGLVRSSATVKSYSREGMGVHLFKTWEARRASRGKGRISELVVDEEPQQASSGGGASTSLTWLGSLDEFVGLFGLGPI